MFIILVVIKQLECSLRSQICFVKIMVHTLQTISRFTLVAKEVISAMDEPFFYMQMDKKGKINVTVTTIVLATFFTLKLYYE